MSVPASSVEVTTDHQNKAWYLVYTKPKGEKTAHENLTRQGYKTYLPLITISKRRRGRYVSLIESMFSRYLFIQLNQTTDNWAPIRSTLGVASMVRFSGYPAKVPAELIEMLRKSEDEIGLQQVATEELKAGNCVQIIEGPMTGLNGIYQAQTSADRAVILLDMVGKHTRVMVDRHHLQLAE